MKPEKTIYDKFVEYNASKGINHNLTNNQHKFVMWLLENHKMVSMIGSFEHLFTSVRKFIKNNQDLFK